jgi:hypothetical protein
VRHEDADPCHIGGGRLSNVDFLTMAAKVGANEILAKPFDRPDSIAAVRRLLPA